MDLNYLAEVLKIREQEIKDGKNLFTCQPIYVVLSLQEHYCSGHSDYSLNTNNKKVPEFGFIDVDLDPECREFHEKETGMKNPEEITRFWTDDIVAFFLTSEAAHSYVKYQSHNMNEPYVYVFYSGYRNQQMDKLLNNE